MITVISYVLLKLNFGVDWTGWLLVLPILIDLSLKNWIDKVSK